VLIGAGLRKVDLTAAYLSNAYLARADLRGAKFGCTTARLKVSNETPNDDNVPSEDSKETKKCAHLQNASLHLAKLPGAQLDRAELQGASLSGAHLEGATFTRAQLQGANLEFAELEGASLDHAELQGASLGRARLQGASLDYAELSGASLESAQMAGASLRGTDLQGAVLRFADFGGALLKRVHVWRIDPLESSGLFFNAFVEDPQVKPDEWSVQSYQELRRLIRMTVPEGWARDEALSRIAILDPRRRLGLEEKGEATTWLYLAHSYPSPDPYRAQLSARLQEIACTADGAPYVIQGLRRQLMLRFGPSLKFRAQIVTAFLDETTCPGTHGLSDDDTAVFRKMRDNAAKGS
jgi:uncharacterized protein YjbI with pentapeptide repeats